MRGNPGFRTGLWSDPLHGPFHRALGNGLERLGLIRCHSAEGDPVRAILADLDGDGLRMDVGSESGAVDLAAFSGPGDCRTSAKNGGCNENVWFHYLVASHFR